MAFCSEFDEALSRLGPAGVFMADHRGEWRFLANWTRDLWGRAPGPHAIAHTWTLARDHDSGFVTLLLITSPTLIKTHPRHDLRFFNSLEAATEALAAFGTPAQCKTPW